jgi:hypothetical protein
MKTYYFAIIIAILILGSTLLITSWGYILTSIKAFFKRSVKASDDVDVYYKHKHTAKIEIQASDRDALRRKK